MDMLKSWITKYWLYAAGGIVGGVGGYIYWLNWACDTGCPLTETPTRTVLYGVVLGGLLFSMFTKKEIQ